MDVGETILLDSSLISQYKKLLNPCNTREIYDCKVIDCGNYIQFYFYENHKSKNASDFKQKDIKKIDTDNLYKSSNVNQEKNILLSNAIRSHLNCDRLAKTNQDIWESFITLTFKENITDINKANKVFSSWTSNIKKLKSDFMYLAVPEFQKRGAVHYHILSNLGLDDKDIILKQKTKTGKALNCDQLYDVKYWSKGFVRVDFIKHDYQKIYAYISKYMTKDIDNKLFGKRRYLYSMNLKKPTTSYLNLSNQKNVDYFNNLINGFNNNRVFESEYEDIYTKSKIKFIEIEKAKK